MNSPITRYGLSVGFAALLIFAGGCAPDSTGPRNTGHLQVGSPSSSMLLDQVWDDCGNGWYSCHFDDLSYADKYWSCPVGCHTFPLNSGIRNQIYAAQSHINGFTCAWAKNYINQAMTSGRIRYYNQYDGAYGDIHTAYSPSLPGPDNTAMIHIYSLWAGNATELARTLVHEAFHAVYNDYDEDAANRAMAACV
jgi:hypothetical protein